MKKRIKQISRMFNKAILITAMLAATVVHGQAPTHLPQRNPEPVGFFDSTENIIFFVVIPIIILIVYVIWRNRISKDE